MKPLIPPQVNLNGTAREELVAQHHRAARAIEQAVAAMIDASPHPRDYQPRFVEYRDAVAAWSERVLLLTMVMKQIEAQGEVLYEEGLS